MQLRPSLRAPSQARRWHVCAFGNCCLNRSVIDVLTMCKRCVIDGLSASLPNLTLLCTFLYLPSFIPSSWECQCGLPILKHSDQARASIQDKGTWTPQCNTLSSLVCFGDISVSQKKPVPVWLVAFEFTGSESTSLQVDSHLLAQAILLIAKLYAKLIVSTQPEKYVVDIIGWTFEIIRIFWNKFWSFLWSDDCYSG